MTRRRAIEVGAVVWAIVGAVIALRALAGATDAAVIVWVASFVGPLCALAGAFAIRGGYDRTAGLLLLLSAATPTYFAYALNIPSFLVGACLLIAPHAVVGERHPAAHA